MDKTNDRHTAARFWRDISDSDFENSAYFDPLSDSSIETSPFRGFEKEPKVLIEKFNIEPFLNTPILKSQKFEDKSLNGKCKILPQLLSRCYVKLVREDLNRLKKDVLENSRLKKIKAKGILSMPFLHCKICEKAYESEKKLQNHLENKHMLVYKTGFTCKPQKRVSFSEQVIVHEVKRYHKCRKCTKIYEEYKYLKTHMKQSHRKRKCYICHYCSKNFVDRMFFKVHIKLHCHVCGLLFPNRRKYLIHRRDSCRIIKKYTCKTCLNLFFSYMGLKDHSYDHLDNLFICDICKDQHTSKCAVSHHILFLHSKKRPKELYTNRNLGNERLYLCNFCEASSIDRDVIDKHLSVLPDLNNMKRTGYKDYYFCDQCLKKFDTETNMLQHKWSHFLNASENSQVQSNKKIQQKTPSAKPQNETRRIFKIHEKLPNLMQPRIVLEKLDIVTLQNRKELFYNNNQDTDSGEFEGNTDEDVTVENAAGGKKPKKQNDNSGSHEATVVAKREIAVLPSRVEKDAIVKEKTTDPLSQQELSTVDEEINELANQTEVSVIVKKALVDPKSKKTLISRFQCEKCHKYYSNNYCLNRHRVSVHQDYDNLQCHVCEESFVWPSLLKSHNCIRRNIPDMSIEDASSEVQLKNYGDFEQAGIDELMNISESEDYMNSVDFDIPAPMHLMGHENRTPSGNYVNQHSNYVIHNSYKIVMQEVPIEF